MQTFRIPKFLSFFSACVEHSDISQIRMDRNVEQVSKHFWNFICLLLTFSVWCQVCLFDLFMICVYIMQSLE